jgi:hypothetical protein
MSLTLKGIVTFAELATSQFFVLYPPRSSQSGATESAQPSPAQPKLLSLGEASPFVTEFRSMDGAEASIEGAPSLLGGR